MAHIAIDRAALKAYYSLLTIANLCSTLTAADAKVEELDDSEPSNAVHVQSAMPADRSDKVSIDPVPIALKMAAHAAGMAISTATELPKFYVATRATSGW
jgi:hypothetical protein